MVQADGGGDFVDTGRSAAPAEPAALTQRAIVAMKDGFL
jgi:hypothetical protein